MAKDPAYLFYSSDFLTGTMTMTLEDRGKYITILCLMHQQGRLDEETIRLLVGSVSVNLKRKFQQDENGLFYNARLEEEIFKRNKFTESRRNNGLQGGRPKETIKPKGKAKQNLMVNHKVNLMEDENINENVNRNKDRIEIKNENLIFPFYSKNFKDIWTELSKQPKWKKKTQSALQASLKILSKYSEPEACDMMTRCIAGGWQGLVESKKSNYDTRKNDLTELKHEISEYFANTPANDNGN